MCYFYNKKEKYICILKRNNQMSAICDINKDIFKTKIEEKYKHMEK